MFDLLSKDATIDLTDKAMTLITRRTELIASNMANIDTPGYRTKDFDFESALRAELNQADNSGWVSMPSYFSSSAHSSPPVTTSASPAYERNDGNDVSLDKESMKLSLMQTAYQVCTGLAAEEIRTTYLALREGEK
jgi:flagellar basal-body rod protein FlgB